MPNACPIPTPAEREYGAIVDRIQDELTRTVHAALEAAAERARSEIEAAGLDMEPPAYAYFEAFIHQRLYCTMCGADPTTFEGGRADTAMVLIRNSQNIARHYWGAKIEPSV